MEQENTYPTQQNFEQQQPEAMELEGTPKYQQSTTDITPIKQSTPISTEQSEPNKPSTVKAWLTGKNIVNKLYGNPNYEKYSGVEITDKDENETGGLFFEKVQSFAESLANRVNFVKIKDIQSREVHSLVDVVAFVKEIRSSEYKQIIGGKIVVKAAEKVYLYDDTYSLISLTLPENTNISLAQNQVVVIKGARISDYSGTKTLAVSFATKIITDSNDMPSDPAIFKLLEWRNTEFNEDKLSLLNESADQKKKKMSTIEEIYYSLWDNSSTLNIALTAYISYIDVDRSDIVYPACENVEKCARKATPAGEDWYKCEHCGITFRDPIYRYNLQVKLSDPTGSMWVSIFDKVGNIIMGIDANMVNQLKKENQARVTRIFKDALNKEYKFTIQARNDHSGRLDKIKARVTEVEEIEYSEFNNNLLGSLQAYKNK